jgi:hypothetical protein
MEEFLERLNVTVNNLEGHYFLNWEFDVSCTVKAFVRPGPLNASWLRSVLILGTGLKNQSGS